MLLRNCRPYGGDPTDILIEGDRITAIGPGHDDGIDCAGKLVLPGLIDAHCHLDKTLHGGPWVPHSAGDPLTERIANERRRRPELGLPNPEFVVSLLDTMAAAGTCHARTHTDVYPDVGIEGVHVVAEAAKNHRVSVQQVAFPQHGILSEPGMRDLLDKALAAGATTIGGLDPAGFDRDPVRHLDVVFGLAADHGAGVDIHLHDGGTLGEWELELIAAYTEKTGLHNKVAVSHAYALGQATPARQRDLATRLADAGVAIITCAVYDFPVPPLKVLHAAGVRVATGHDGIRDLWGPYGSGDMLERAMHLAYRSTFRRDEDIALVLEAATDGAAQVLGLTDYGLRVGARADLVVIDARTVAEAVVTHPPRTMVITAGKAN